MYSKSEVLIVAGLGLVGIGTGLRPLGWLGAALVTAGVASLASKGSLLSLLIQAATVGERVGSPFGGIAKGYAIDLACARLRDLGIENAIVNAGGDLRAMGHHGERPWKIAVRSPGGGIIGRSR